MKTKQPKTPTKTPTPFKQIKKSLSKALTIAKKHSKTIKYVIVFENNPNYKGTTHWLGKWLTKLEPDIKNAYIFNNKKDAMKILKRITSPEGFLLPQIQSYRIPV